MTSRIDRVLDNARTRLRRLSARDVPAALARGAGLVGLKDRIEALGGTFSVHSPVGGGTTLSCELPVRSAPSAG